MRRVRLWVDEPSIGNGAYSFLVVEEHRKFAILLYVPLLQALRVTMRQLSAATEEPAVEGAAAQRKIAGLIRKTERDRKRFAKRYSGAVTRTALAQLRGTP